VEATTKRLGDKAPLAIASTNNLSKYGQLREAMDFLEKNGSDA
jgi:hypothetical protein